MRSKNSLLNFLGTLGAYLFNVIFNLLTQSALINILGVEYTGINGILTNIVTMLSIAELGIGTTIIYKLYKPLSENNFEEIKSWLYFYKKCYMYIAFFVLIIGLIIGPLVLRTIEFSDTSIVIYAFGIVLLDTVISYIMTYKRSILYADQKNYIINLIHILYIVFMNLTQIVILHIFKNFIAFLIIKVMYRIIENILINSIVDKKYSFINSKDIKKISSSEEKDVFERVKAMLLQKVSFVINKGIDSIIISYIFGVAMVGYYSNYNMIVSMITAIIYQMISSLTASVGNLLVEKDTNKNYLVYKKINMLNSLITTIGMTGFICSVDSFITIWLGKEYILDIAIKFAFLIYIYSDSIRRSITLFKEAAGICKEDKYMYIWMIIINVLLSIVLSTFVGVCGVIWGTAISYLFLIFVSYPKYIFKPIFNKAIKYYYLENLKYLIYMVFVILCSYYICTILNINNTIIDFCSKTMISLFIPVIIFILVFRKNKEYNYYCSFIKSVIKRRKNDRIM